MDFLHFSLVNMSLAMRLSAMNLRKVRKIFFFT